MNLVFFGTPEFAVPTLEKLVSKKFAIELVVTNPDEPRGRGYEVTPPPVKIAAQRAGLEVFQPAKIKAPESIEKLSRYKVDVMVVVAYGHILPKWLLDVPRHGCINVHASLLPKYRGAAPIQWAVARGESVTGVTTMRIDVGLDTGDMLLRREMEIRDEDTAETLGSRLSHEGADLLVETLRGLVDGTLTATPQNHAIATLAPILKKEDGRIDWALPAREIWNRIRGLRPWPGAFTSFRGKNLHIWLAPRPATLAGEVTSPGILIAERTRLQIVCGDGVVLEPQELQLEGRKRMPVRDFLNGMKIHTGESLGA